MGEHQVWGRGTGGTGKRRIGVVLLSAVVVATSLAWATAAAPPAGAAEPELQSMCDLQPAGIAALVNDTTLGPDGNVWYTSNLFLVGKVTPAGVITSFGLPNGITPVYITAGPDDDLWFTTANPVGIGRITTDGEFTHFTDGVSSAPKLGTIALGPDGALWFGDVGALGRITPDGAVTHEPLADPGLQVASLAFDADGGLWFSVQAGVLGHRDPSGAISMFPTTDSTDPRDWPGEVVVGADGDVWFTIYHGRVGRLTPSGSVTEYGLPSTQVLGLPKTFALEVDPAADGGTYRLGVSVDGGPAEVTDALSFDADGATIVGALRLLPNVGVDEFGNPNVGGDAEGITFDGDLVDHEIELTVVDDAVTTGGAPAATPIEVRFVPQVTLLTSITPAADGSMWFAERLTGRIGRVTADGFVSVVTTLTQAFVLPEEFGEELPGLGFPALPGALTLGGDGNVWLSILAAVGGTNFLGLGRLTPDGDLTSFDSALPAADLAVDADGVAWFTSIPFFFGSVTPEGVASLRSDLVWFLDGPIVLAGAIAIGPDGNRWIAVPVGTDEKFSDGSVLDEVAGIVRVEPDGEWTLFAEDAGITAGSVPTDIVAGPDGNLWFTEPGAEQIGRITPDGVVTEFHEGITGAPIRIAVGGDGALWFTEADGPLDPPVRLGRITTDGVVTTFDLGLTAEEGAIGDLTGGPDGNVWFTDDGGQIGRITPTGEVTFFPVELPDVASITAIASAGGDLWFAPFHPGPPYVLGRITTDGEITYFETTAPGFQYLPGAGYLVTDLAAGADGALWLGALNIPGIMRTTVPDRVGDPCDHDEDGDSYLDYPGEDAFPTDPLEWADADADTVGDNGDNCPAVANADQAEHDTDGTGDACDTDDDGDGLVDTADPDPVDPDVDDDTKLDGADNCISTPNTDQANLDGDAQGDACDLDDDGDTVLDLVDAFPRDPAEWADTDLDQIGNNADLDDDGDDLPDLQDPAPLDSDADDDTKLDGHDNCVTRANTDQLDTDGDGIGDVCDRTVYVTVGPRIGLFLEARIVDGSNLPVPGKRVVFTNRSGRQVCVATTDRNGRARCGFGIAILVGLFGGYKATFAGDSQHDPASAQTWR